MTSVAPNERGSKRDNALRVVLHSQYAISEALAAILPIFLARVLFFAEASGGRK